MTLLLDPADEAVVAATPLFAAIDRASTLWLVDGALVTNHPDGGLLFSRGDKADRFFVVLAGRVDLFALTEGGDQSIIEVIDKGHSFAEGAIFAGGFYPLNAELAPGARLVEIPAHSFLKRLAERKELAASLLASLARWQRRLMGEIADLKGRSPAQRLGLFLLAAAEPKDGTAGAEGSLPLTKSQLASRIGITPESLSWAMNRLRPLGVSTRVRRIVIADVAALRKFCGGD